MYVTGCLSERYRNDLAKEIPNVDAWFGTLELPGLLSRLNADYQHDLIGERLITTPPHYAYLKISEGCNRTCAFCAIPLMRGKHISRPIDSLVEEARSLARRGVKELTLRNGRATPMIRRPLFRGGECGYPSRRHLLIGREIGRTRPESWMMGWSRLTDLIWWMTNQTLTFCWLGTKTGSHGMLRSPKGCGRPWRMCTSKKNNAPSGATSCVPSCPLSVMVPGWTASSPRTLTPW